MPMLEFGAMAGLEKRIDVWLLSARTWARKGRRRLMIDEPSFDLISRLLR